MRSMDHSLQITWQDKGQPGQLSHLPGVAKHPLELIHSYCWEDAGAV
jgi:hypothetical protein